MTEIQISENDKRAYRFITLDNNLQATLIHDPDTEKSAACVDVRVGSMCDPENVPGLAHFLEHMLFMGTEKYPVENAYSAFLSAHGGHSNAYTAQEDTVYYFDVQNSAFEEALDLFASFFTCPLFSADSTDREINAVDNENTKNLQSDNWRSYQLLKSLAAEGHPFHQFSTGNAETLRDTPAALGINVRELLLQWYREHYSASIMKLVVYGKDTLDTMQEWVRERFSAVPNVPVSHAISESPAYTGAQLRSYVEVVPVRDSKNVDIYWVLPPTDEHYRSKPTRYISHLIGHESGGSILSALKARGWANSLSSGDYQSITEFSFLCVSVELTEEGFKNIDSVIHCVFTYVDMLRRDGACVQWIADEVQSIAELNFRFINKSEPSNYVTRIANNMQIYPQEHIVSGTKLVFDADTSMVPQFLDKMTLENSLIFVQHKSFSGKTESTERWYGTEYNHRQYSEEQCNAWTGSGPGAVDWGNELRLPDPNPFVPTDFRIRHEGKEEAVEMSTPEVILREIQTGPEEGHLYHSSEPSTDTGAGAVDVADVAVEVAADAAEETVNADQNEEEDEGSDQEETEGPSGLKALSGRSLIAWHKLDRSWLVPKTNVLIKLETMMATCTAANVALTEMFTLVLKEAMNEFSYYADCAGLHYDVQLAKSGVQLSFFGYHHKLPVLITKTAECMANLCSGNADVFARVKEKTVLQYANYLFWQPYMHCLIGASVCMEEPRYSNAEKHAALKPLTLQDFHCFAKAFVSQLKAEVLVHGNAVPLEAKEISEAFVRSLGANPLPYSMDPIRRVVDLQAGFTYLYRQHSAHCNPAEKNSAIMNLYRVCTETTAAEIRRGVSRVREEAMLELLAHLLEEPSFDQLRTKEQLGYIVNTSTTVIGRDMYLRIIVQSNSRDAAYLDERIETFLATYRETLVSLSAEELQTNINATVELLLERPKNLDQEASRHWEECNAGLYLFDRKRLKAKYLSEPGPTLTELVDFFDKHVSPATVNRVKFSSQFFGEGRKYPSQASPLPVNTVLIKEPGVFKRQMRLAEIVTRDEE